MSQPAMLPDETPKDSGDGNPYTKGFSQDGRGGTKPTPGMKPGGRYIYYRLYTKGGPFESNSPIFSNDNFMSRIVSSSVRPPHTTASLIRYLCKIEGLAPQNCILFQSLSEMKSLDHSSHLSLRETTGPGASDLDPMALVVDKRTTAERRLQVTSAIEPRELLERDYKQRYVYYRVYDDDGETVLKTSFSESNPSLGRVNTLFVPPPHTVSCFKNFVISSEGRSGHNVQLFQDEGSESAMDDSYALTLLSDTFPGYIEDQPIAITYESATTNASADNDDPNEIQTPEPGEALTQIKKKFEEANVTHTRELEEANRKHARELAEVSEEWKKARETHACELAEAREGWKVEKERYARELAEVREGWKTEKETHARELAEAGEEWKKAKETHEREINETLSTIHQLQAQLKVPSTFKKKLKATYNSNWGGVDTRWHSTKIGEIFYTDGIPMRVKCSDNDGVYDCTCYLATNSFGKLGFVADAWTEFC